MSALRPRLGCGVAVGVPSVRVIPGGIPIAAKKKRAGAKEGGKYQTRGQSHRRKDVAVGKWRSEGRTGEKRLLMGVLLATVGVGAVPVTVIAPAGLRTIGVHAGGVEAGLGGILVGVVPVVGVVPIVGMIAIFMALLTFMAVPTLFGVRMGVLTVRMAPFTVAPAGRERKGKRGSKKNGEYRRRPVAVHGAKCSWLKNSSKRTVGLRQVERLSHCSEESEVPAPEVRLEIDARESSVAVRVRRVEEFDERHFPFAVAGLGDAEQVARTA